MYHSCADLESYIKNHDRLLKVLCAYGSEGNLPTVDEMVEWFMEDSVQDPVVHCHWLAMTLALTLQRLVHV